MSRFSLKQLGTELRELSVKNWIFLGIICVMAVLILFQAYGSSKAEAERKQAAAEERARQAAEEARAEQERTQQAEAAARAKKAALKQKKMAEVNKRETIRRKSRELGKLVVYRLGAMATGYSKATYGKTKGLQEFSDYQVHYGLRYREQVDVEVDLGKAKIDVTFNNDVPCVKLELDVPCIDEEVLRNSMNLANVEVCVDKAPRGLSGLRPRAESKAKSKVREKLNDIFRKEQETPAIRQQAEAVLCAFYKNLGVEQVTITWRQPRTEYR